MLRNTEEKFMKDENHRIKFVSKVGTKLINMFHRKDPFQVNCVSDECNPCVSSKRNPTELSNCKVNNICYSATCNICEKPVYILVSHLEIYTLAVLNI